MSPSPPADEFPLAVVVRHRVERLLAELSGAPIEGLHPAIMREVESALLETVLAHTGGHRDEAARILGLHRNSLRLRLRALGVAAPRIDGRSRGGAP